MNKKHAQTLRALGRVRPSVSQVKSLATASSNRVEEIDEGYVGGSGSEESEGEGDALDVDGDVDMDGADGEADADEDDEQSDEELERNAVQLSKKPRERVMQTDEARAHLRLLFKNEPVVTSLLYGGHGPFARTLNVANPATPNQSINAPLASADMFFMDLVPVPPTRFRPAAKMGEIVFENPQNELLSKILTTSYRIVDLTKLSRSARHKPKADEVIGVVMEAAEMSRVYGMLLEALIQLQIDVNSFMDSNKNPTIIRGGKLPPSGVKQTLEKKDGLFRKHMMVSRSHTRLFLFADLETDATLFCLIISRSPGKASQLRCPIGHLARHQPRDERDWSAARVRAQAHLSRAGHEPQLRADEAGRHQRTQSLPGSVDGRQLGRKPDLARQAVDRPANRDRQPAARPPGGIVLERRAHHQDGCDQQEGVPSSEGR